MCHSNPRIRNLTLILPTSLVQRCRERNCATPEKSELRDSFIRPTLLAEVGRPSNKRWPFDNIGKSTMIQVLTQESGVESCP
jgi:hypothetical protein